MVQTDGINFGMYSQRPFEWYMTRLSKLKISWRRGKQYTSPVTVEEMHNNYPSYLKYNIVIYTNKIFSLLICNQVIMLCLVDHMQNFIFQIAIKVRFRYSVRRNRPFSLQRQCSCVCCLGTSMVVSSVTTELQ